MKLLPKQLAKAAKERRKQWQQARSYVLLSIFLCPVNLGSACICYTPEASAYAAFYMKSPSWQGEGGGDGPH